MKRVAKPFLALSLQLALLMQLVPLAVAVTWSDDIRLTEYSALDVYPAVTQLSDGKIWVAWESNIMGNTDILYMVYDWTNWSPPDILTEDPNQDNAPSIFQARNGTIWLFWASDRTGNFDIFYKTYNGSIWSRDTQLTNNPQDDKAPSAIQAIDGRVWVVWQRSLPGSALFYTIYNGTWSEEHQLTDNPGDDNNPKHTQTADGRIWVTWSSSKTGNAEIFYKIHNGSSWSTEYRLTTSTKLDVLPSITQTRDGAIWIVWTSGKDATNANDDLYYNVSYDNGDTWSGSTQLTSDPADDWWSSIAQISDKKLWVFWASNRYDNYDIYYKTSSEIIAHDVAITDIQPAFTLPSQGQTVPINVTAKNKGDFTETFTVTCYINSTLIGSQGVTLGAGASTTLTFQWDTATFSAGKYIARASASSVPGENIANTFDNTLQDDEVVRVRLPGDVDVDGDVDIADLSLITKAFGSDPNRPEGTDRGQWNPNADINNDNRVDVVDLYIAATNYGRIE